MITWWALTLVAIGCLIGSFGPILLKKASADFSFNILKWFTNWNLILGMSCYALSTILFIPALKGGDLSVLYPLYSLGYVLVCFYSIKILKEKMNFMKWLGVFLIIIGVSLIGVGSL